MPMPEAPQSDELLPPGFFRSILNRGWKFSASRVIAFLLGAVFLVSGLAKTPDMMTFIAQVKAYGLIGNHTAAAVSAWALVAFECALGTALVVGYRLRITLGATLLLLLVFLGATVFAWHTGVTEECGCFGTLLPRSPAKAALEDGAMLLLALAALWMVWGEGGPVSKTRPWLVLAAGLTGVLLPVALGFPVFDALAPSRHEGTPVGKVSFMGAEPVDLEHGKYLVALMDADCLHCQEAVPMLNGLENQAQYSGDAPGVPRIIALCMNGHEERAFFTETFLPAYPLYQVSPDDFYRLLGDAQTPIYLLIADGRLIHVWKERVPDFQELLAL